MMDEYTTLTNLETKMKFLRDDLFCGKVSVSYTSYKLARQVMRAKDYIRQNGIKDIRKGNVSFWSRWRTRVISIG